MIDRLVDAAVRALNWWLEGLWLGLPTRLRARWFRERERVIVRLSDREATVECPPNASTAAPRTVVAALDDPAAADTVRSACGFAEDADVIAALCRPRALTKRLWLPAAAESALPDVLRHELDRLTPFAIEDVVFDQHVRQRAGDRILVEVALARRDAPAAALESLARLRLRPTTITAEDASGEVLPVNLLRERPRLNVPFAKPPIRWAFAAGLALAMLAALYVPLLRYHTLLARYDETVAAVRKDAVTARAELQAQEAALARTDFLAARRGDYVPPIELLLELTNRLPEHTWLTRASFSAREVQLQGESAAASDLLQIVESAERLKDAQFQAPVSRSSESGKELFTIVASPVKNAATSRSASP